MNHNEVAYSRNKLMSILLWLAIVFGAVGSLLSGIPTKVILTASGIGGLITLFITFLSLKRIFEYQIRFLAVVGITAVAFLIIQSSPIISSYFYVFLLLIIITLYNDYKPIILAGIMAIGLTIYSFYFHLSDMFPGLELKDSIRFSFYIVLTTVLLSAQSKIGQNMMEHINKEKTNAFISKEKTEKLLAELKKYIEVLDKISTSLANSIHFNNKATTEISEAFGEIAKGIENQAATVSEINTSMSKINHEIVGSVSSSTKMNEISSTISIISEKGNNIMSKLRAESRNSNDTIKTSIVFINELNQQGKKIGEILSTLNDIAEQTNLLALNATIEAARAGEQGRGFSVVADEIRKLAFVSREATEEISDILNNISNKSNNAYQQMTNSEKVIKGNESAVEDTIQLFDDIAVYSNQVIQQSKSVEAGLNGLRDYASRFISEISSINKIAEQHAASMEEIFASTDEQKNKTESILKSYNELNQLIKELNDLSNKN